jgi:hypothetical protein
VGNNTMLFVTRRRRHRDERGSLLVAIAVIFVLVMISSAIGEEVVANQHNVVSKAQSAASVSAADSGVSDALFQLDQMTPGPSDSAFCMHAGGAGTFGTAKCVHASQDLTGVSYIATPSNNGATWSIQAKATVGGITGAVQETVNYSAAYPYAVFGNSGLDFNGMSSSGLGTYTEGKSGSSNPDTSTSDCINGVGASCVSVGSNGPIKCAGGLAGNVTEVYYTGGGGASKCANPSPDTSKYALTIPSAPTSGTPLTCPGIQVSSGGVTTYELGSGYAGAPTSLSAGTYYCNDAAVDISGSLSVTGTVLLYIILDSATNNTFINSGIQTLYIAGGSEVNTTFDGTSGVPPAGTTLPDAGQFRVLSNSTGSVGSANGEGAYTFGGILYAPEANLVGNGCKSAYYGSLTINTLTCNGGPHLQVYYDSSLSQVYGPPAISGYAQINPQSVTVP